MTGPLAVVTSHSRTGLMPLTGLLPITDPSSSLHHQTTGVYLAWIEKGALDVCDTHLSISRPLPVLTRSNLKDSALPVTN